MKCPMCFKYNTINILRNLWLCNDCGHKFIDEEDIEGIRAYRCVVYYVHKYGCGIRQ